MIELRTFGALDLRGSNGRELRTVLAQPKRLALLVYLAAAGDGRLHRRDTLLALFWPDLDTTRGRAALSRAVHYLRTALGEGVLLSRGDEELGLAPGSFNCDASRFRELVAREGFADALQLYHGEFMEGFFLSDTPELERWIQSQRQRFRETAGDAARRLSIAADAKGDLALALHWARQEASLAPYDESSLRRALVLLQRSGERGMAAELYQQFARRLRDELEVEPSLETTALASSLAADSDGRPLGLAVPVAPSPPPPPPAPSTVRHYRSRRRAAGLAALAFGVLGGSLLWTSASAHRGSTSGPHFVAVLPLANVGTDTSSDFFSDGMTDELIATLSQVRGLRVAARTSSFVYKNRNVPVAEISRDLHVDVVLEGSARELGDHLRIILQLVRAPEGYTLWSKTYDRDRRDVFTLQREISQDVADALKVRLVQATAPARVRETDPETYDLYLWGRYYWNQRRRESLLQAVNYFERAIARDSMYAPAYSGLADAYGLLVVFAQSPREVMPKAKAAALRALALDETQSEAHAALAYVATVYEWDWRTASHHFQRALELNPSNATAHHWYSMYQSATGHFAESIAEIDSACELNPAALMLRAAAGTRRYTARDYSGARQRLENVVRVAGDTLPAYQWLLMTYLKLDRVDDAMALVSRKPTDLDVWPERLAVTAAAYARAGRQREARVLLRRLDERAERPGFSSSSWIARGYAALGDTDRVMTALERAFEERDEALTFVKVDPSFDFLHDDPRFQALLDRMGLR